MCGLLGGEDVMGFSDCGGKFEWDLFLKVRNGSDSKLLCAI